MKTEVRLGSIIKHGVGGPEAGCLEAIYSFLLEEFGQNFYSIISINQIGDDTNEIILLESEKKIHINIRYPISKDFEEKTADEKNIIGLDVIHIALLRIADKYGKINRGKILEIKNKILDNNFSFDFICKTCYYENNKLIAKLLVHPEIDRFNYFILIEDNSIIKCRTLIYSGLTNFSYFSSLFSKIKWKSELELLITGKAKEIEMYYNIDTCSIIYKNLTVYKKSPYFEIMRADISPIEKEIAYKDWIHSLPPTLSALIVQKDN